MFLIITVLILFVFYAGLIFYYNKSWRQAPVAILDAKAAVTRFSIIIPARNEEQNIGQLLHSIQQLHYPASLFEIIVIDDHSTDGTAALVETFNAVKLIRLQQDGINSYKKKAIETGIANATNEWIVCTDADCVVPQQWLKHLDNLIQHKQPVFIAAQVSFTQPPSKKTNTLFIFQCLDFMTLQGITAASVYKKIHSMCNGANLAYKKDIFYEVDGFKGVDNIASGDDMLLMHKIWKRYPQKVQYLKTKEAIVETDAAPTWKAFFNQRIRWASKAKTYDDKRIFSVLLLVYLFNLSFVVLAMASFFNIKYLYALFFFWCAKTIVEYPFIIAVSLFFNRQNLLKYFFLFQPLHIAYTIISGFLGSFGKYEWKGRKVK